MLKVKEFKGHSGCMVELYDDNSTYKVIKSGSPKLAASADLLDCLRIKGFKTPKVEVISEDKIEMEYINGVDMKTYIERADNKDIDKLISFINSYFDSFKAFEDIDIRQPIVDKLSSIEEHVDFDRINFSFIQLLDRLPQEVTVDVCHGDFTLDNILYYKNDFYLIDANPTDISCVEYDGSKLRQDLDCLWFVRNKKNKTNYRIVCNKISNELKKQWTFLRNDSILIFMLLRILPYCTEESTRDFLYKEINKLWP